MAAEDGGRGRRLGNAAAVVAGIVILFFIYRWKHAVHTPVRPQPFNPRQTVRVQVLNGCGTPGAAGIVRDYLMRYRVDIRETGNAPFRSRETLVIDRVRDAGKPARIAELLGVPGTGVIQQINANLIDIDVTVIVGQDFDALRTRLR